MNVRFLADSILFSNILNISSHCLLTSIISHKKSAIFLMGFLDWEFELPGKGDPFWQNLLKMELLSTWAAQGRDGVGCVLSATLWVFLLRYSKFSWIEVSSFAVCPYENLQTLNCTVLLFSLFVAVSQVNGSGRCLIYTFLTLTSGHCF